MVWYLTFLINNQILPIDLKYVHDWLINLIKTILFCPQNLKSRVQFP